ncbi:MAG: prolipoprotein diacylglyceryl transferase [Patescibacteria group bacterium]
MNFFHYFYPQPIIFQFGPLSFRWYGLIIVLGLLLGILVAGSLAKRRGLKFELALDLGLWLAVGGILGARLYQVFVLDWSYYSHNLPEIFKIWQGGLAIHGAIIGGIIVVIFWSRKKKISFWQVVDLAAPALALGQAIGRWGNYFNQELFGRPTNLPWGIPIEPKNRPEIFLSNRYFQPAFLYESVLDFVLFLILFLLARKNNCRPGSLLAIYFIGYGLIRFFMEFIRIDETALWWGIRLPQIISVLLIIAGVGILKVKATCLAFGESRRKNSKPKAED